MAKIAAATNRLYRNVFICKNCSAKIRSNAKKIAEGKVKCRKCKKKVFRPVKKK